jgi:hypothetical protein
MPRKPTRGADEADDDLWDYFDEKRDALTDWSWIELQQGALDHTVARCRNHRGHDRLHAILMSPHERARYGNSAFSHQRGRGS